ncbi:hypothetical protein GBAR_LOCUS31460 [Geodia barretti]|uniref:Uncharacterized protein n=1 Tax=Geodia barretti TaxID=519541 RepID=A0AA35U088_GEOBA|nr:hypothetical protein GBAR_LOCUS31460 [Geodia barretti]
MVIETVPSEEGLCEKRASAGGIWKTVTFRLSCVCRTATGPTWRLQIIKSSLSLH